MLYKLYKANFANILEIFKIKNNFKIFNWDFVCRRIVIGVLVNASVH